jgi:hypothetical protein
MPVALQAAVWGAAAALVLSVYVEVTGAWDLALTDRVSKDVLVYTLGAALAALLWRGPLTSSRPAVRLPAALAYLLTVWPATALMLVMIEIAAAVAAGLPVFGFLFTAPVNLLFILALDAAWLTWPLGVLAAWSLTRRPA